MNIATRKNRKGFTLVELLVVISIIVALAALATPQVFKALKRANLTEGVNNARQAKLALDAFAADNDTQFPSVDTAEDYEEAAGTTYSNDYFKQLFLSGATSSEEIFWAKGSGVASKKKPDNKIKEGDRMQPSEILKAGECHWAYITDQGQTDDGARPIILDGYPTGTSEFDPKTWDNKVIVAFIDGSVKGMKMRLTDFKVLDGSKKDILSSQADVWGGVNVQQLLKQPQPKN